MSPTMQQGLLVRTPKGRICTERLHDHLGIKVPSSSHLACPGLSGLLKGAHARTGLTLAHPAAVRRKLSAAAGRGRWRIATRATPPTCWSAPWATPPTSTAPRCCRCRRSPSRASCRCRRRPARVRVHRAQPLASGYLSEAGEYELLTPCAPSRRAPLADAYDLDPPDTPEELALLDEADAELAQEADSPWTCWGTAPSPSSRRP